MTFASDRNEQKQIYPEVGSDAIFRFLFRSAQTAQ